MKELVVNKEACIGCGACVAIDPTHFDFDEDNLSEVISNENILTDEVSNAISSCPTNAIKYTEKECHCGEDCECDGTCKGHCECNHCDCEC